MDLRVKELPSSNYLIPKIDHILAAQGGFIDTEAPEGPPLKAVRQIAGNYSPLFFPKLSLSPKHPHALSDLALAALANGCWQSGHLFNPSAKASQGGLIILVCICPLFHLLAG